MTSSRKFNVARSPWKFTVTSLRKFTVARSPPDFTVTGRHESPLHQKVREHSPRQEIHESSLLHESSLWQEVHVSLAPCFAGVVVADYFDFSATENDLQVDGPLAATRGVGHLHYQEAALLYPCLVGILHVLIAAPATKKPQTRAKETTGRL